MARSMTENFPHDVFGWKMLGAVLKRMGRNADALAPMKKTVALSPSDAGEYNNLGATQQKLGLLGEAEASYRRALQVNPDYAEAHYNLGVICQQMGRLDEAKTCYQRLLEIKPDYTEAHYNLGVIFQIQDCLNEAETSYRRALEIKPDFAEAHVNLGLTAKKLGKLDEAEANCRQALEIKPDLAEAHYNLGLILKEQHRLGEAEASYRRALKIKPNYVEAYNSLGLALRALGRLDEAEASYLRALEIKPDFALAQYSLSMVLLAHGQFQRGWQCYEMRWKWKGAKRLPETPYPCWLGEKDIAGKKLLIQAEQGVGDAIQMLRYVSLLEQKNIECWIQVPESLHHLVARSFPCSRVVERHVCPEGLDYRIPVMSLPLAMRTFSEQLIPRNVPYLIPSDGRVSFWQKQLASTRSRTVGLVWRGNPKMKDNHYRSASLADLLPLIAAFETVQFVTLQKDVTDEERNALKDYGNARILDDELTDFDETAAVMSNLDIMVSMCTGPAHLSGALGKPTWVLLTFSADWRWMVDRLDSPWYPTAKLFRQKSIGNWAEVVSDVKTALADLVSQPINHETRATGRQAA